MVYFRLKFTLSGQPRTALLTDRGWTLISGTAGQDALLNHLCPLGNYESAEACAIQAAGLLRATIES